MDGDGFDDILFCARGGETIGDLTGTALLVYGGGG